MTDADLSPGTDERTRIRPGGEFEREYRLDANEAGTFPIDPGEQLRDGEELTLVGDGWGLALAFAFASGIPVEPEVEVLRARDGPRSRDGAPDSRYGRAGNARGISFRPVPTVQ